MGKSILELFESNKISKQIPQAPPTSGTAQGGQFLIDRKNVVGNFLGNALGTKDPLKETAFDCELFYNRNVYKTDEIKIKCKK